MSRIIDIQNEQDWDEAIAAAAAAVSAGEIIIFPTDTVYGIAASAFDADAVAALLAAKGRDRQKPPPVMASNTMVARALTVDFPQYASELAEAFWPGALTMVLPALPTLDWDLGETGGTVALRVPDLPFLQKLLQATGPLAVTSANITGRDPARTAAHADEEFGPEVKHIFDGGPVGSGPVSTIVDCTGPVPKPLRMGALTMEQLREVTKFGADLRAGQWAGTEQAASAEHTESTEPPDPEGTPSP